MSELSNINYDYSKVHDLIKGYDSTGQDLNRLFVEKGIDCILINDIANAHYFFRQSGLSKAGIMYFAIRKYVGPEENQIKVIEFILKHG